jgi:glycosyltransferase involved in cell wall biosynthesis
MRVVVIARSFTRGGSATGAANLVKALESVDLEVVTLDSELSIQKRNIYRFLYYLERALDRVVFGKSVSYFRIRPHTFSLDEILQQYNPDVIQLCDISSHAFNLKNIKNSNIPIFHRLSDFWPYLGKKHYPEKNDVVACSDLYKKKSTLHLVTPSEWLKNEFVDRLKLDSNMHPSIIYNATYVAESYLKKTVDVAVIKIGFIASNIFSKRKGLFFLLSVIESLKVMSEKKIELYLWGSNKSAKLHRLPVGVFYMGFYQHNNLENVFHSIDYLFCPSIIDNSPNVVTEAISFGLPVVVQSGTGAVSYVRNEFGLVFNFQDSSKGNLLELCTWLKADAHKYSLRQAAAHQFALKNLTFERVGRKYLSLFNDELY